MGFFDSTTKKTTNNNFLDQTTTNTTQVSGGDSNIGDGAFVAANSNISTADNSVSFAVADNSLSDNSVRTSSVTDSSDNSFKNTQMDYSNRTTTDSHEISDNSNRSFNDYSSVDSSLKSEQTDNSNRSLNNSANTTYSYSSTDGGAFSMVSSAFSKFVDGFTSQNKMMADVIGLNSQKTLDNTNAITARSMDAAFAVKSGSTISEPMPAQTKAYLYFAGALAAIGGVVLVMRSK